MSDDFAKLFDAFFNGRPAEPQQRPPRTTDAPNIKMLMLQIINKFHADLPIVGELKWHKPFRHKETGKVYEVEITLREVNAT